LEDFLHLANMGSVKDWLTLHGVCLLFFGGE